MSSPNLKKQRLTLTLVVFILNFFSLTAQAASPFTTEGKFSVGSDGSANYSIPIIVPPGTAGMQPQLALSYNSNGGNGIVGMGWGIDGLSQIGRCPTTLEQDGVINGVNYTNTDRFCLDGQRLIAITDTYNATTKQYTTTSAYGANGTEYRTESANFAKIISYGQAGTGPAYFKVWTKSGQIIEYGNTADSGIEAQGKPTIRTWGVNKISDTKGNYIAVTYTEDNANGEAYVQKIDYTGNTTSTAALTPYANIQFIYEARPDITTGYQAGSVLKTTKRLTNIQTYNATTLIKNYKLTYELSQSTQRSRLKTIQECDGNSMSPVCKQSLSLNWQATIEGWEAAANYVPPDILSADAIPQLGARLIDMNGDGLPDFVRARYLNANRIDRNTWLNTGNGWLLAPNYAPPDIMSSDATPELGARLIDVNGDGLPDLLKGRYINASNIDTRAWLNTGSSWTLSPDYAPPELFSGDTIPELGTRLVDLNGDGLPDLLKGRYINASNIDTRAWLNTGHGWVSAPHYAPPELFSADTIPELGTELVDLNGDGLPDLLKGRYINASNIDTRAWLNTGHGWLSSPDYAPPELLSADAIPELGTRLTDLNGDGLPDLIKGRYINASVIEKRAWLNTGAGWISAPDYAPPEVFSGDTTPELGTELIDLNGDGLPDLIKGRYINASFIETRAWLNTGRGWVSAPDYAPPEIFSGDTTPELGTRLADLNGDGLPDLVKGRYINENFIEKRAWFNTGRIEKLISVASSASNAVNIQYTSITFPLSHQRDSNSVYPIQDVQAPIYVVSSTMVSDGLGGILTTNYQYGGLKSHLRGRGSLGFRYVKESSLDNGISVTTFYRQDFPFIGLPSQVEKRRLSDNALLSVVQNTYANSDLATSTIISKFPYLSQSVEQAYELDGSLVSTTTTNNQYDGYGNVTSVKVDDGLGNIKTTTSSYSNNVSNWLLGRLIRSTVTSVTP